MYFVERPNGRPFHVLELLLDQGHTKSPTITSLDIK